MYKHNKKRCYKDKCHKKLNLDEANVLLESGNSDIQISTKSLSDQIQEVTTTTNSNSNSILDANPVATTRARGIENVKFQLTLPGIPGGGGGGLPNLPNIPTPNLPNIPTPNLPKP